MLGQTVLFQVG